MEVELKLALDASQVERFLKAPALAATRPRAIRMDGIYLDTADCELERNDMALRLRRANGRWMQCLKAGRSGTGGLHSRGEWEHEQPRPVMDLALFRDTPLASLPSARTLHRRLGTAFRVTFERTAWKLRPAAGSRLEVALDRGIVASGKRTEALCEVEIECLEGDAAHAFDVAETLLRSAVLRPSAVTKARRGYRLFRGERLRPVRAGPSRVRRDMTPAHAARAIVAAALDQLQANEEGLLASDDPEFVHQLRVALRRLRSALRIFAKPIGSGRANSWRAALAGAGRRLGEARDWDVFATETLPALLEAYGEHESAARLAESAAKRQALARKRARKAVKSRGYARALLRLSRWLALGDAADPRGAPLEEFAARRLRKRHKRLARGLDGLASASMAERHGVRIDAKRLRYVVEGLAPALDARAAKRYARRLSRLQDALGRGNDAVTGARLLARLAPPRDFARFAKKNLAARIDAEASSLDRLAGEIVEFKPFWRHP